MVVGVYLDHGAVNVAEYSFDVSCKMYQDAVV